MNNDLKYWEAFYEAHKMPFRASDFAPFCLKYFSSVATADDFSGQISKMPFKLLELGCGNGRDSLFFAKNGLSVLGVDMCQNEIEFLKSRFNSENLQFLNADFTTLNFKNGEFDAVYSRFTLHSIDEMGQDRLFSYLPNALKMGGFLCIETRGFENSLYKMGEQIGQNCFIYEEHFRRFVEFGPFCEFVKSAGFELVFAAERSGFAPFNGEDDRFIRVVARKIF